MKKVRILSIDGGGIRGLLSATCLKNIENLIQEYTSNDSARLSDYFDLIVGTSTGGILSCLFVFPDNEGKVKFSAKDIVGLYKTLGKKVFSRTASDVVLRGGGWIDEKYDAENLENALNDVFKSWRMSALLKPTVVTAYDIESRKAFFFRSESDGHDDFTIKDALRSTAAAPTYFEPLSIEDSGDQMALIDGGVYSSNPALCAYAEARGIKFSEIDKVDSMIDFPDADSMMILSIGTGVDNKSYPFNKAKDWGKAEWILPMIRILLSANAETNNHYLTQIFNTTEHPDNYLRLNIDLPSDKTAMDSVKDKYLDFLEKSGQEMFDINKSKIQSFISRLV